MHHYYSTFQRTQSPNSPPVSLFQQLYLHIKHGIVTGAVVHTSQIPPTRVLAQRLQMSRNTVLNAMAMLKSEGLVTSQMGSGLFVHYPVSPAESPTIPRAVSEWSTHIQSRTRHHTGICSLGVPDTAHFPRNALKKAFGDSLQTALIHSNRTGHTDFIDQIQAFVLTTHGMQVDADMIIPVPSTQSGCEIILKTLFDTKHTMLLDCPCYMDIISLIRSVGMRIAPHVISPDTTSEIPFKTFGTYDTAPPADAVFVTPAHQYPLGYTMSSQQRISLVQWATKNNAWIIEDSTDSTHTPAHTTSLYSMCPDNTLFLGSFSKILTPGIKVAFIIAPRPIAHKIRTTAHMCGQESSVFMQATVARLLQSGQLYRHIARTQNLYKQRLNHLKKSLPQYLPMAQIPDWVQGGLQAPIILPHTTADTDMTDTLYTQGYGIKPLSPYCHTTAHIKGVHLGFGNADVNTLTNTLKYMQKYIEKKQIT